MRRGYLPMKNSRPNRLECTGLSVRAGFTKRGDGLPTTVLYSVRMFLGATVAGLSVAGKCARCQGYAAMCRGVPYGACVLWGDPGWRGVKVAMSAGAV